MEEEVDDLFNQVITQQNEIINGDIQESTQSDQEVQGTNPVEGEVQKDESNTSEAFINNVFNYAEDSLERVDDLADSITTKQGLDTDSFFNNFDVDLSSSFGVVAGVIVLVGIITIGLVTLFFIGLWNVLKKVNKPGWLAFIPTVSGYVLNEEIGVDNKWLLIVLYGSIVSFIPIVGLIIYLALLVYFAIIRNVSLARAFGKSNGFAVGLILLAPIFYFLLGRSDFVAKNPMEDKIFGKKDKGNQALA